MSQAPYNPIRGPQKHVSQEQMWETLAKHAKAEVEVHLQKVGESPKEKLRAREPLQWQEPVKTGAISGYVLSQCGRFSISKDSVRGKPMYEAWRRPLGSGQMATSLGIRLTRPEAERLCELENARDPVPDRRADALAQPPAE